MADQAETRVVVGGREYRVVEREVYRVEADMLTPADGLSAVERRRLDTLVVVIEPMEEEEFVPPPRPLLEPGTQVVYVPSHVDREDLDHPDCESGFVTARGRLGTFVFVRYWYRDGSLRTISCSESTPVCNLVVMDTVPQEKVWEMMRELGYEVEER